MFVHSELTMATGHRYINYRNSRVQQKIHYRQAAPWTANHKPVNLKINRFVTFNQEWREKEIISCDSHRTITIYLNKLSGFDHMHKLKTMSNQNIIFFIYSIQ